MRSFQAKGAHVRHNPPLSNSAHTKNGRVSCQRVACSERPKTRHAGVAKAPTFDIFEEICPSFLQRGQHRRDTDEVILPCRHRPADSRTLQ